MCGKKDDTAKDTILTPDESYFIETYLNVVNARDLYPRDSVKAESLFTAIDTTTDSLRIANTIQSLNQNPERWVLIYQALQERLQKPAARGKSEDSR